MERLTKRIIFGREVPTVALCNAPFDVCNNTVSCGSCDFLHENILPKLAAYEDTNHTPEECAAAFKELAAYRAAEQDGTLLRLPCKVGDLLSRLENLQNSVADDVETYTTGYRNGHRNGQAELIRYILGIGTGSVSKAEAALKE